MVLLVGLICGAIGVSRNLMTKTETLAYPLLIVGTTSGMVAALKFSQQPFVWIFAALGIMAAIVAALEQGRARMIFANISSCAGVLLILELFAASGFLIPNTSPASANSRLEITVTNGSPSSYFERHPELGYAPVPGVVATARRFRERIDLYDVTYSIDSSGLRELPATSPCEKAVLLFGNSNVFGEGVEDSQTFAAVLQEKMPQGHRVFNFGFHGYGPHQMLRRLELEAETKPLAGCPPVVAIYFAIADHVDRAAGRSPWDRLGPRYERSTGGRAEYKGAFTHPLLARLLDQLHKSSLMQALARQMTQTRGRPDTKDLDRFVAIVSTARDVLTDRYQVPFFVLLWGDFEDGEIAVRLEAADIRLLRLETLVPGLVRNPAEMIIPHDGHLNARAHAILGDSLARHLTAQLAVSKGVEDPLTTHLVGQ
jgi:hypothetical protein